MTPRTVAALRCRGVTPPRRGSPLDETLNETRDTPGGTGGAASPAVSVLVLVWSHDEPERCGEAIHLPLHSGDQFTIGRALELDDGAVPLCFGQLRPGGRVDTGPLQAARISRRQLAISNEPGGGLRIEQTGRSMLRLDGHAMATGVIHPGSLIEVENRILLLHTTRPATWVRPRPAGDGDGFAFGGPDPWGIVGESPVTWALRQQIAFLAARDEHVLVVGPSGSGKELVVQALHARSRRAKAPLISRNAATIPEALIDAELFGNLRNYPNPGMPERPGLLGEADGGALLLDEIGELSQRLQAHLLRVLDQGEYQRLGETRVRRADLRLLAATNRDPAELKHDFLARFPHRLRVPGLDERPEDIPLIVRHLLRRITAGDPALSAAGVPAPGSELVAAVIGCRYSTHVRELQELLWRALHHRTGDQLTPPPTMVRVARPRPNAADPLPAPGDLTREAVRAALDRCDGVKEAAWRELGLRNRYQLHRAMKKLGME